MQIHLQKLLSYLRRKFEEKVVLWCVKIKQEKILYFILTQGLTQVYLWNRSVHDNYLCCMQSRIEVLFFNKLQLKARYIFIIACNTFIYLVVSWIAKKLNTK